MYVNEAVEIIDGRSETEASGGINLNTVSFVAETGVDYISMGGLTHSTKWLDFSMILDKERTKSKNISHARGSFPLPGRYDLAKIRKKRAQISTQKI